MYKNFRFTPSKPLTEARNFQRTTSGLPIRMLRAINGYIMDQGKVNAHFFEDWVHEYLTSSGYSAAEEYMPEIYEYLERKNALSFD